MIGEKCRFKCNCIQEPQKEVIGENAETGYVHTLKDNNRVKVPVDELSVKNAIGAIEWAVKGILQEDFPMRACSANCTECDYRALCRQEKRGV